MSFVAQINMWILDSPQWGELGHFASSRPVSGVLGSALIDNAYN